MRTLSALVVTVALLTGSAVAVAGQEPGGPTATEALLSGMVTEEVEPGVFRVVHDGFRDLTVPVRGYPGAMVDVTPDGGVWLSDDEGRLGLFRLGEERVFEDHRGWPPFKEVAPDGSLWVSDWLSDDRLGIFSFDGGRWTVRATTTDDGLLLGALAVGADSTVWLAARDPDKHCPDTESIDCIGTVLLRVEDDGTTASVDDWTDVYEGDVAHDELAVGPDGDVWLIGMERWDGPEAESLLRFDGDEWQLIPGPDGFINNAMGQSIALGPDGTLWVHTRDPERSDWNGAGLARFDDPGWTTFTETDGVEDWGGQGFIATELFDIIPDGSLWMNGIGHSGCDGVDHYDGTTWTSYLRDSCVHDLAIAPDGSVWVRADIEDVPWNATSWDVGLYVITPEARG